MRGMEPGSLPAPPAPDFAPPTTADVLRWCAAAAPDLWFPSVHAQSTGIPRDSIDDPLWLLRQAGLLQVGDWVRGKGQGYSLTPAGEKALADPQKLTDLRPVLTPDKEDVPPDEEKIAEVIIGKQRNGPIGTVKMVFLPEYARFENAADQHRQPSPF